MAKLIPYKGLILHLDVMYYDEIERYAPGFKVEKDGWFTQRIAKESRYYAQEDFAEERSLWIGRQCIDRHLTGRELLYFDYQG